MKANKWMFPAFLVLSVTAGLIFWMQRSEKTIQIGFPNQTISFGMSVSEVVSEAGIPNRKHEEDGIRSCKYVYTNMDILGYTGSIVYIFDNREDNKNAKVITAYLTLKDESQTKCDEMMDDLQNYFENNSMQKPFQKPKTNNQKTFSKSFLPLKILLLHNTTAIKIICLISNFIITSYHRTITF